MRTFFLKNSTLISINLIYALSIFFSTVILPSILIKEYNFSSTIISISGFVLAFSFLIGTFLSKELLKRKYNYFIFLRYLIISTIFLYFLFYLFMQFHISKNFQWLLIIFKIAEGIVIALFNHTINHLFFTKLLSNNRNIEIKGTQNTFYYIIKASGPLLGGIFVVAYGSSQIFLVSIFLAIISLFILEFNSSTLLKSHWKDTFHILAKNQKRLILKKITLKRLKFNKDFIFKTEVTKKFYLATFIHNNLRFYYDFYFIIFLTLFLHISYIQSGFLVSLLIIGQSVQFISGILIKKINESFKETYFVDSSWLIYSFPISLFSFLIYLNIYNIEITYMVYIILSLLTFLTGFSRAMFASFSDKYLFEITNGDRKHLSEYNAIYYILGDIGNLSGYIIGGILVFIGYKSILIYLIVLLLSYLFYLSFSNKDKNKVL